MTGALAWRAFRRLPGAADGTLARATVGDRLVCVEVETPAGTHAGVAHRPDGDVPAPDPGTSAASLVERAFGPDADAGRGQRALGAAALNALSAPAVDWRRGDPMERLTADVEAVATVGLFRPAFRKFDAVEVRVVERTPVDEPAAAPSGVAVSYHTPEEAGAALAGVDVVFVTGSTVVYGGLDRYLDATDAPTVVLVGATASFHPAPAFEAGVTVLAGARVTDPERVRAGVAAGACGTDLHGAGLRKVYATGARPVPGLDVAPAGAAPGGDRPRGVPGDPPTDEFTDTER